MPATELITVSIPAKHPSGSRRRGGFEFLVDPSIAEVTAEQKAMIKADPYMIVHRRLSQAWFSAMGIERTEANEKRYAKEDPEDWQETARVARRMDAPPQDSQPKEKTAPGGKESQDGDSTGKLQGSPSVKITSSKSDIIKALEGLGLKAGTDFDSDANRNALFAVYSEKATAKASPSA